LAAALGAAAPAAADWLQMKDGSRVETRGAWEVRGGQVVFTLPNGTLASTRTADVDLGASRELTELSKAPRPEPTPPPKKKSVLVLTDADVGHAQPSAAPSSPPSNAEAAASGSAKPGEAATANVPTGVEVSGWSTDYSADAGETTLAGTLHNTGDTVVFDLGLVVSAFDEKGGLLTKSDAVIGSPGLSPGGTTTFEVRYPGLLEIKSAKFEIKAQRASLTPPPPPPAPTPTPEPTALAPIGDSSQAQRLQVVGWQPETTPGEGGALALIGELSNRSSDTVYDVKLLVTVLGPQGETLASGNALIGATTLQPGQTTNFRASFPGVGQYQNVRFEARHSLRIPASRPAARPSAGSR
jgi:hypothetical protein